MTHNTIVDVALDIAHQLKGQKLSAGPKLDAALDAGAELLNTSPLVVKKAVGEILVSDRDEASDEALSELAIAKSN